MHVSAEILIGISIGRVTRLSMAAEIAGEAIAMPSGFAAAQAIDPPIVGTDSELSVLVLAIDLKLALPLLAVVLMADVALAFVPRAAPTVQIFNVGSAVLLGTGAVVLMLSLPGLSHEIALGFDRNAIHFERLLAELRR